MSCYSPLKAFDTGVKTEKGKPKLKILPFGQTVIKNITGDFVEGMVIPCGRCIGCRLDYSREWAIRSYYESLEYKDNYFVTLTYDDVHIPKGVGHNIDNGVCFVSDTLFSKHLTKFIKDLRRYWEYHYGHIGIRFMASGEYGDKTRRPHYHLIFYNLPIKDLRNYKTNFNGDKMWNSDVISKIWGKGHCVIAEVNWETSAYVARYVMKKQTGKDSRYLYQAAGEEPEFIRQSRNPGLARAYFERNYEKIYATDEVFVNRSGKVIKSKPVKYFDRLYEEINSEHLSELKNKRRVIAENNNQLMLQEIDITEFEYLILRKDVKNKSLKFLSKKTL